MFEELNYGYMHWCWQTPAVDLLY